MMEYNNLGPFLRRTDLIDNFVDNQKLREQQKKPNRTIKEANQRRWEQYQAILRAELEAASMRASITAAAAGGSFVSVLVGSIQNRGTAASDTTVVESISCLQSFLNIINQL